jgi:hypothetical protein
MGEALGLLVVIGVTGCAVVLATAWWLRSGAGRAPSPPGFVPASWTTALKMGFAQQVRANLLGLLAIVPGVGHLVLGRVGRALAVVAAIAATIGLSILIGTLTGTCGCEAGSSGGRLRVMVTLLVLLAIILASAWDATRIATRRVSFRALLQSAAWAQDAETKLDSCPRCRNADRTADGFCEACIGELSGYPLELHSAVVRATALGAASDPELAALRGRSLVLGSIAGEAARLSPRFERAYASRLDRLLRSQQRHVEGAWRDPAAPERLWTVERVCTTSYDGDRSDQRCVCLYIFGEDGLSASWTTAVLRAHHARAPRRRRLLHADPAPQTGS